MIGLQGTSSAQSVIPTAYAMPQSVVLPIADTALLTARTLARYHFPEDEREQLKQRQREGIEIAKAQGKYTGRKPIPTDWTRFGQLYGEWRAKHITGRDFMRRMNMSANTFYRRVREYELRHGITEPTSA